MVASRKGKRMKVYKKPFLITIVLFALMMQVILEKQVDFLGYIDELFAVASIIYIFKSMKLKKEMATPLSIMVILILIGITGNLVYNVQGDVKAILMDIGNMFKGFVSFLAVYRYFDDNSQEEVRRITLRCLNRLCKILVIPGVFLAILNLITDIGMHTEYVYGMRAFHYIFLRVGNLNGVCAEILMILTANLDDARTEKQKRSQVTFIIMTLLLMMSTLRSRAFIYIALYIAGYCFFVRGKRIKVKLRYFLPAGVAGIYIGWPKVQFYFLNSSRTARAVLLRYGIRTAVDYFPIGAGFGTYGTYAAKAYRSQLYSKYNFSSFYGLSEDFGGFLTDDYWPAIIAEFGFFGAILMLGLIVSIFGTVLHKTKSNAILRFAALFGTCRLCIESFVSSSFFHTSAVIMLILTALVLPCCDDDEEQYTSNEDL